jgi:hypothetical protein
MERNLFKKKKKKKNELLYFLLMLNMDEFVQLMHHKMLSK